MPITWGKADRSGSGPGTAPGTAPGAGAPVVFRPVGVRIGSTVAAVLALWWVGALLAARDWSALAGALPLLVAALAALHGLFWRPAVVIDDAGVELRNVLRDVRVPWSALEAVDTRFTLTLVTAGRRYQSWAAPASGRPGPLGSHNPRDLPGGGAGAGAGPAHAVPASASRNLRADSGAAAFMVEQRWRASRVTGPAGPTVSGSGTAAAGPEMVRTRWNLTDPLLTVAGLGLGVLLLAVR